MSNSCANGEVSNSVSAKWRQHSFYKESIVLGLDVGLEGIGVCVRRGGDLLYARTWLYDIPEAARLEGRRQLRGARHCRANRKVRMQRLCALFAEHGLPWLEEDSNALSKSNPFILRHRAVASANGLASREALAIAIRHCVAHRGHDYEYFSDEGAYPWGDATEFKKVMKELEALRLTRDEAEKATADAIFFDWKEAEVAQFRERLTQVIAGPEDVARHLAEHAKGSKNHIRKRARGEAFPRKLVRAHLDQIIERHAHLLDDPDTFSARLFRPNKTPADRDASIFYYHRKTKQEMEAHFEKKRARCPYAVWLELGDLPTDKRGVIEIRRWSLLEFAANRDVEVQESGGKRGVAPRRWRVPLSPGLVQQVIEWQQAHPEARLASQFTLIKDEIISALEKMHGAKVAPEGGKNGSELNKHFFTVLRDLLAPSMANRARNAPMSAAAAARLFEIATMDGFDRAAVHARLENCRPDSPVASLYDFRRQPTADLHGIYPQVEFLLGQRVKKAKTHPKRSSPMKRGDLAVKGRLQRLFDELISPGAAPDYCVVEVARDLPRNQKQKREREVMIAENRERHEKLIQKFAAYLPKDARVTGTMRRRIELHDQQGGICPFTGEALGLDPLSDALDLEHLFPESRGGLTVNENLVLTFVGVNRNEKKNRTPREYAAAAGRSFDAVAANTSSMRWGRFKREVFAWADAERIPEFGNTTRVSQLARQLSAEAARWMDCRDADEHAARIAQPTGFQTAACRRAWGLVEKDREDLTHHLVDAVILAHIPPREGQNYVQSGGIFLPRIDLQKQRVTLDVLPLGPDPLTVQRLSAHDATECPVIKHRSSSRTRSMHDKTLLRVLPDGTLAYRKELPDKATLDPHGLRALLVGMGIPATYQDREGKECALIPSHEALKRWLDADGDEPLRLLNGTPVRHFWERGKKGTLTDDPTGFHGAWNGGGRMVGVKAVLGRWEALELWRGWNGKKKRWEYYKRLIPSRGVFQALRSLGYSWEKKSKRPWRAEAPELTAPLKRMLGGALPPHARRAVHPVTKEPVVFRTGETFRVGITQAGKLAKRGEPSGSMEWVDVAAVMQESGGRLRFLSMLSSWKKDDGRTGFLLPTTSPFSPVFPLPMIQHLILLNDHPDLHVQAGRLHSGSNKIAVETLGSVQCFSAQSRWSQSALESLATQCPVVMARWEKSAAKWRTFGLAPKARHVNPTAIWALCRVTERRATQLASDLLFAKIRNQHAMLRVFDPLLSELPRLADNSFSRILHLEAKYARFFWARYFAAVSQDLFEREKRRAQSPLNTALNYGYGFLYHALEWQCLACGLETSVGLIHKLRRSRPSLACDLIEPLRCCVELTVTRHLDEMHDKKAMSARFAEMLEAKWMYRRQAFRLRSILRLYVESFVRALTAREPFEPFRLHARDACL